jgi:hypothetical protein
MINADKYTPINDALVPVGTLDNVGGTRFDFRVAKKLHPAEPMSVRQALQRTKYKQ